MTTSLVSASPRSAAAANPSHQKQSSCPSSTSSAPPSWFAANASKAHYERQSLVWAPLALFLLLTVVVGTPFYAQCSKLALFLVTLVFCFPGILLPLLSPAAADRHRPLHTRFWPKATVWIAVFSFYGNYFWTHYFYTLLGAQYLFKSYRFNDVPLVTYTCTFFYFTFYFNLMSLLLRRVAHQIASLSTPLRRTIWWTAIATLSYLTAVFEAVSIQHFPLYTYTDRERFFLVGSVVYGLYFIVGFPFFFALEEPIPWVDTKRGEKQQPSETTLYDALLSSLAAVALVTLLLDLWRLSLGSIYSLGDGTTDAVGKVPFIYQWEVIKSIARRR